VALAVDGGRSDTELFSGEETVADGELVIGLRVRCLGRKQIVRLGELIQPIFAMPTGEGTPRRSTRRLIGALPEFRYGCVIDS
jgi:hypothetical protein